MTTATANLLHREPRISKKGRGALLICLVFVLSTDVAYRISLGGLLVHPYLLLAPLVVILGNYRLFSFANKITQPLFLFLGFFTIAQVINGSPTEPVKVASSVFTLLFFYQAVRTRNDLEWISVGLILVAIYVAFVAVQLSQSENLNRLDGANALEGLGNKNAQSLFTLPGFFFCVFFIEQALTKRRRILILLYGAALGLISLGILYSANRSGYIGAILIVLSLVVRGGFSVRNLILSGLILVVGGYLALTYTEDIIEHKLEQTTEGYSSDQKRQDLIVQGLLLGLENPVFGLGHDGLHEALPDRIEKSYRAKQLDTHNTFAYILGSSGLLTFMFFVAYLYRSFYLPRLSKKYNGPYAKEYRSAVYMARVYLVLFLVRCQFTREILYSPTFLAGMGLVLSQWYYYFNLIRRNLKSPS